MMKSLSKEKVSLFLKKSLNYLVILISLGFGILIGANLHRFKDKNEEPNKNPYSNIHSSNDVSIAVDELDNMLVIDRKTGEYQVFEDSIGINIFRLYAKNIYKKTMEGDINE